MKINHKAKNMREIGVVMAERGEVDLGFATIILLD